MSDERNAVPEEQKPHRRFLRLKNIAILVFVLAFGIGLCIEIWKHSDKRLESMLKDNRQSFEACAEFFGTLSQNELDRRGAILEDEGKDITEKEKDSKNKMSGYAAVETLADIFEDDPIAADINKLAKAGVQKITLYDGEVRFYTDINSGLCYISQQTRQSPGFYYPAGYLDDNRIDGDWYRFGSDVKKK